MKVLKGEGKVDNKEPDCSRRDVRVQKVLQLRICRNHS